MAHDCSIPVISDGVYPFDARGVARRRLRRAEHERRVVVDVVGRHLHVQLQPGEGRVHVGRAGLAAGRRARDDEHRRGPLLGGDRGSGRAFPGREPTAGCRR